MDWNQVLSRPRPCSKRTKKEVAAVVCRPPFSNQSFLKDDSLTQIQATVVVDDADGCKDTMDDKSTTMVLLLRFLSFSIFILWRTRNPADW